MTFLDPYLSVLLPMFLQYQLLGGLLASIGGLVLIVIGILVIIILVAAAIVLLPAILLAVLVFIFTGSLLFAGVVFLAVALVSLVAWAD